VKIGDLVQWNDRALVNDTPYMGIVVDGPREGCQGTEKAVSYEIAWFNADLQRAWHNDHNLKLLSDCHRALPADVRGNEL